LRKWRGGHCVRGTPFNFDEEPMGSTSFGNVTPVDRAGDAAEYRDQSRRPGLREGDGRA
jgi:hypothetical protein